MYRAYGQNRNHTRSQGRHRQTRCHYISVTRQFSAALGFTYNSYAANFGATSVRRTLTTFK